MALRRSKPLFQHSANRLVTAPTVEPVTADDLRTLLRESVAGLPDIEADGLIEVARQWFEDKIGAALIDQTWRLTLDNWPVGATAWWNGTRQGSISELHNPNNSVISPPRWPLSSVTGVTVYSDDGTPTALVVADIFDVDTASIPSRIALKLNASWPTGLRATNAIEILYVAGYGTTSATVPAPIKRAILQISAGLYTHRGDGCDAVADTSTKALVDTYKIKRV
jgi:hypothetical protein